MRDTCVALLEGGEGGEGGEREAEDKEESSEEVDKDKRSCGGSSSSVRIESALVVRLERVACHHTSETTKQQSKNRFVLKSVGRVLRFFFLIFFHVFNFFFCLRKSPHPSFVSSSSPPLPPKTSYHDDQMDHIK